MSKIIKKKGIYYDESRIKALHFSDGERKLYCLKTNQNIFSTYGNEIDFVLDPKKELLTYFEENGITDELTDFVYNFIEYAINDLEKFNKKVSPPWIPKGISIISKDILNLYKLIRLPNMKRII
jgi:hypothetical protein